MTSIEEKAKEYSARVSKGKHFMDLQVGFIAGYKAAQEWISVEDELPENMRTVIVRDNGISPIRSLALFQDNIFYPDFCVLTNENITHWRPINND